MNTHLNSETGSPRSLFSSVLAVGATAVILWFLTAPPIMKEIAINTGLKDGKDSFPLIYKPIVALIHSRFNGPVLWYFNEVWNSEIILIGETKTPPLVLMLYIGIGGCLVAAFAIPIVRHFRRSASNR